MHSRLAQPMRADCWRSASEGSASRPPHLQPALRQGLPHVQWPRRLPGVREGPAGPRHQDLHVQCRQLPGLRRSRRLLRVPGRLHPAGRPVHALPSAQLHGLRRWPRLLLGLSALLRPCVERVQALCHRRQRMHQMVRAATLRSACYAAAPSTLALSRFQHCPAAYPLPTQTTVPF